MLKLNEPVLGFDNEPELDTQETKLQPFDRPVEITYLSQGRTKTGKFRGGLSVAKKLTFRRLMLRSIRNASKQNSDDVPGIDRCTELIQLLFADSAEIGSEERGEIIKCVKAQGDPLYLLRVKELFDENPVKEPEEKPKRTKKDN